ncbi:MAG TPA: glycosyltransferase family 4 protein [Anaerolineales bacterium]
MKVRHLLLATGIYPPDIGGPARVARILAEGCPAFGVRVRVANFSPLTRDPWGIRHVRYLVQLLAARPTPEAVLALDPISSGLPAWFAASLRGVPFIVRIGGDYAWEQATERFHVVSSQELFHRRRWGWRVDSLAWLERWVARRARLVITPSEALEQQVVRWGVPSDRVVRIPNAVVLPGNLTDRAQARQSLHIKGRLILSIGRLMRFKNHEAVIESVASLRTSQPDLHLVILGDGPHGPALARLVEQLGMQPSSVLLGRVGQEAVFHYLRAADLFVMGSSAEGMSHALLEAMAAGTPVIATDIPGNRALIDHLETGWLVPVGDREALRAAIVRLLAEPALANRLANRAQQKAQTYGSRQLVQATVAALEQAL